MNAPVPQSPVYRALADAMRVKLKRSPDAVVPPAFRYLLEPGYTYYCASGGRMSGKSWSVARVLLLLGMERPERVLCCREVQSSLRESAYRLLVDMIIELGLDDHYTIQSDSIHGKNGSVFFFEGLHRNGQKLKSYERITLVWAEESQTVSDMSWELLIPTVMRNRGARFYITWNPLNPDGDPVDIRFVKSGRPDVIHRHSTYLDNPHLPPEALAEMEWLRRTDGDAFRHVWLGEPRTVSEAQILRGKFEVAEFEVQPHWAGPYHGCDFGFARDPNAAIRIHIDDTTQPPTAYVSGEHWSLGTEIDALPDALERSIPGISRYTLYCDAARPETVNYLQRHGIPRAVSAEKWSGSVDDGIAYLRSLRIVIAPECKHFLDECNRYSFRVDRLTGATLPEPEDKHNHLVDSARYALSPLIRNKPTGGYFSRSALLEAGEPLDPPEGYSNQVIDKILMTVAPCERPGSGVGVITWAHTQLGNPSLIALDYELVEVSEALCGEFLMSLTERAHEHREAWKALSPSVTLHVEDQGLHDGLEAVFVEEVLPHDLIRRAGGDPLYGLRKTPPYEVRGVDRRELPTLDERCADVRTLVNGGKFVKLARSIYVRETTRLSTTTNHFVSQVLGHRPGMKDAAQELVAAFVLGCILARGPT